MDVKEAVAAAKTYIIELFEEEKISDLGLEEVLLDEPSGFWSITIGFTRPWDNRTGFANSLQGFGLRRSYKVVKLSNDTGKVVSVMNREAAA
jgi:hypothetical protein